MSLHPGRRLGAYEIVGPLGTGGMGDVYRARDTRLGRPVAIKVVSGEVGADPVSAERLAREARVTSSLNHPNIVTVHDVGEVDGRPFIVMELIAGDTLHARLAGGPLKPKDAVDIAVQVADGLAAAHGAGVVHRDLKPRNIMFTSEGRVKIVDFGLGKTTPPPAGGDESTMEAHGLTGTHAIVGTAGYMAPEQVTGRPIDFRADQFAFGTIIYEMLAGERAFRRGTPVQTMAAIADADPEPLANVVPQAPAELVTIVERCLAKDPAGRYASTQDLARDLHDVRAALTMGRSTSSARRLARRSRRPWVATAAAAVLLVVLGALALLPGGSRAPLDEARALLARYDKAENVSQAVALLEAAVAANPSAAAARASLAEAYWRQYEHTQDKALIDRASAEGAAALKADPDHAHTHVVLALINNGQGRFNGAVGEADRAIAMDPASSAAHRELGRAYLGLGRMEDAEHAFDEAVQLGPDDWTTHNNLGALYFRANRLEEAASAFQRALDLAPDNTKTYNNLGGTYQRLGRLDDAAAMLERSATLQKNVNAFSNLGTLYYERGLYADAARAFERAVALPGATFRHWRNLAAAYYWAPGLREKSTGAFEQAVTLGEAERAVNPKDVEVLAELASAYAALNRAADARPIVAEIEALNPSQPQVLFTMASVFDSLGDRARALDWLERAVKAGYPMSRVEGSPSLAELRKDEEYVRRFRQ